jgi:hypothetical protein
VLTPTSHCLSILGQSQGLNTVGVTFQLAHQFIMNLCEGVHLKNLICWRMVSSPAFYHAGYLDFLCSLLSWQFFYYVHSYCFFRICNMIIVLHYNNFHFRILHIILCISLSASQLPRWTHCPFPFQFLLCMSLLLPLHLSLY